MSYRDLFLRGSILAFLILLPLIGAAEDMPPETPAQAISSIPFNFAPPGARALGMGACFIAIADDATAAEANPAGLTILTRPEVSAHIRYSENKIVHHDINAMFFRDFDEEFRDFIPTLDDDVTNVSFASYVLPTSFGVFSLYYQQTANFAGAIEIGAVDPFNGNVFWSENRMEILADSIGLSAGFNLGEHVAVGLSLRNARLKALSRSVIAGEGDFGAFEDGIVYDDLDTDLTYNLGLLINPNRRVSLGLVYKEGGSFDIDGFQSGLFCFDQFNCDDDSILGTDFVVNFERVGETVEIPDSYGVGVAWRPIQQMAVAADVVRIEYSSLGFGRPVKDSLEVHVGLEYTLLLGGTTPLSVRCGGYSEQDHDAAEYVDSAQYHYTLGLGVVFGGKMQVDLAAHFADSVDEALLSFVYRF